jgi:hypothetical protein
MLEAHTQPAKVLESVELTKALSDKELLSIRDRLAQDVEQGDTRYHWLLALVRAKITDRARQACLDAEQH